MTYAGDLANAAIGAGPFTLSLQPLGIAAIFSVFDRDAVMHLATKSYADRSIDGSNVVATVARAYDAGRRPSIAKQSA